MTDLTGLHAGRPTSGLGRSMWSGGGSGGAGGRCSAVATASGAVHGCPVRGEHPSVAAAAEIGNGAALSNSLTAHTAPQLNALGMALYVSSLQRLPSLAATGARLDVSGLSTRLHGGAPHNCNCNRFACVELCLFFEKLFSFLLTLCFAKPQY